MSVVFPMFAIESHQDLMQALRDMGIRQVFSDSADLSGINGQRNLKISEVKHTARIDVNEFGTNINSNTNAPLVAGDCDQSESRVTFRVDHPFLFLLRDSSTATVLSMGVVQSL